MSSDCNKFTNFIMILLAALLWWPVCGYGLSFQLPTAGNSLVGEVKTAQVEEGENFSDVGIRFDVGYYEMFESNPGINPDQPPQNTVLIVPTQYLLPPELNQGNIVINLAEMRLYYRPQGKNKVYIFPVGIGKEDWGTPVGEMTIVEKIKNPTWTVPESIYKFRKSIGDNLNHTMPPGPDNPLGKYALRLSQGNYLIHGTNLPAGVGRRSTAGCIRLYSADIEYLYNSVTIGTKVLIINQPYKVGWSGKKLYLEAHLPLFEERLKMGDDMKQVLDAVASAARNHQVTIDWQKVDRIAKEHLTVPRVVN